MRTRARSRRGHTLAELVIAFVLLWVLTGSLYMTMRTVRGTHDITSAIATLESRGHRVMDRLMVPLRAAEQGTLWPTQNPPASASGIQFQRLEVQADGTVGPSSMERIQLDATTGDVLWTRDLGLPSESTTTLCEGVPALLEGETLDLADENGNGLEDEAGLCFSVEDDLIVIRMTLTADGPEGRQLVCTFEGRVHRRNGI